MQNNKYRKFYCPVPNEQRPLNEYLNLKNSFSFNWPTFNINTYIFNLTLFSFFLLFFSFQFTNYFYSILEFPIKFFLQNSFIIINFNILFLVKIYSGWSYIGKRLFNPIVNYEESGWYDNQVWLKSVKILKQDRLIYSYKVSPILKRLEKSIIYLFIVSIFIFLLTIVL
jgi:hypothetical protein